MTIRRNVEMQYFDKDHDGRLSKAERSELMRVDALTGLPFDAFLELPEKDRVAAESLFAAKALDEGHEALARRSERIRRELAKLREPR